MTRSISMEIIFRQYKHKFYAGERYKIQFGYKNIVRAARKINRKVGFFNGTLFCRHVT